MDFCSSKTKIVANTIPAKLDSYIISSMRHITQINESMLNSCSRHLMGVNSPLTALPSFGDPKNARIIDLFLLGRLTATLLS